VQKTAFVVSRGMNPSVNEKEICQFPFEFFVSFVFETLLPAKVGRDLAPGLGIPFQDFECGIRLQRFLGTGDETE
jgi:hypothetical protein